jgi:type IV secretion system protein VirB2
MGAFEVLAEVIGAGATALTYSASLADPVGSSPLVAAVQWLEGTVLGTVVTTISIIAVASIGFMALAGHVDLRRAAAIIIGCFILFGASSMVVGVRRLAAGGTMELVYPAPGGTNQILLPPRAETAYDPYAGASVPQR